MTKVLVLVTQFYRVGGAEGLQIELAKGLNKRGIHADVLSLYRDDLPGVPEATLALKEKGIERVAFLGLLPHPSVGSLLRAAWRLRRLIMREKYDVVETSMPTATALAIVALQGTTVRHIAGIHQVFRDDRDRNASVRALRHLAKVDRRVRYYAVSGAAADAWIEFTNIAGHRVRVIYNSIADEFFETTPASHSLRDMVDAPESAKIVLYLGRLARFKGITTVFDALLPILATDNLVLVCAGIVDKHLAGDEEEMRRLRSEVERIGLSSRVKWLGYRSDVDQLLRGADVLVHPTTIEAFGLVLGQALAAGVPVVASDVEGIPEVLEGTDSIMIKPGDAAALRHGVQSTFRRSTEERRRAEKRGRARAEAFRAGARTDKMLRYFARDSATDAPK